MCNQMVRGMKEKICSTIFGEVQSWFSRKKREPSHIPFSTTRVPICSLLMSELIDSSALFISKVLINSHSKLSWWREEEREGGGGDEEREEEEEEEEGGGRGEDEREESSEKVFEEDNILTKLTPSSLTWKRNAQRERERRPCLFIARFPDNFAAFSRDFPDAK